MSPGDLAGELAEVRRRAGLFALSERALLSVTGDDRERWLNGMISNDVATLAPGSERSGCYATLLTPQGRIVSDLHVLLRPDAFWLELDASVSDAVRERLERYIIADDVTLAPLPMERWSLEGPEAAALLSSAAGSEFALEADSVADLEIAGEAVVAAAYGFGGGPAFQLFVKPGRGDAVVGALSAAAGEDGLARTAQATLEVLRIEAGVPRMGLELGEDVLPDEARLDRAISTTKGCYTGQEIVARIRSQGRVSHLLVGLHLPDEGIRKASLPIPLKLGERKVGELTSACISPDFGAIGLGFVRRAHSEPGVELQVAEGSARVAALPFAAGAAQPS